MTEQTLRDLLIEASDGIRAPDLATPAITHVRRRDRRRRVGAGVVAATVVASVVAVIGPFDYRFRDAATGPNAPAASAERSAGPTADTGLVGGWEILGVERWFALTNRIDPRPVANYHAATFYAVNRTSGPLSPRDGPELTAQYQNAPGQLNALCEVIEIVGKPPQNREELRSAPLRQRPVAPGEKVLFACFQRTGTLPSGDRLPESGRLKIDGETARFHDR